MSNSNLLGQLNCLHQAIPQLLEALSESDCYSQPIGALAPLAWYLGQAVFIESQWIDLIRNSTRSEIEAVRSTYQVDAEWSPASWKMLPNRTQLLEWCRKLQDDNIMLLANPATLPVHPLLEQGRLIPAILQRQGVIYEKMVQVLAEHGRQTTTDHQVQAVLEPSRATADLVGISQGHYRIGAKSDLAALDNELPTQVMQLSNFQIDRNPVSNSQYLSFIHAKGYQEKALWSDDGWHWLKSQQPHPNHWQQDNNGNWYGIGINGAFDLPGEVPVSGISLHEATAYSRWLSQQGDEFTGAVIQHEYQWEAAVRTRAIEPQIAVWEWCANTFAPYTDYQPDECEIVRTADFNPDNFVLRGSSLHTPAALRRVSYRNHAPAGFKHLFSGVRLVYPPRS